MKKQFSMKQRYILLFLVLLPLCCLFPYTGDDWAWGSSIGLERLSTWFDNYSGRYVGNLIVLALTRSNLLKTVAMAACIAGCVILINELTKGGRLGFWILLTGLVLMPVTLLRQSIVWTAGFANYTTSIFFTLLYLYLVRDIYEEEAPSYPKWLVVPVLVLGFCNALIVEHMTIYNVLLGAWVVFYSFLRFRKIYAVQISYLIASIAGTLYLFSNSVYHTVAVGGDGYREIGSEAGLLSKIKTNYLDVIYLEGFLKNTVLLLLLLIVCILLWQESRKMVEAKYQKAGTIALYLMTGYTAYSFINMLNRVAKGRTLIYAEGFGTLVYIAAVFVFLVLLPLQRLKKTKVLFLFFSTGLMIGPLFAVSPIGSRCFFAPYLMMLYLVLELYGALSDIKKRTLSRNASYLALAATTGFLFLLCIYGTIYKADRLRIQKAAEESQTQESIQVKKLPYAEYLWCCEPTAGSVWEERFKLFYGLSDTVTIENT